MIYATILNWKLYTTFSSSSTDRQQIGIVVLLTIDWTKLKLTTNKTTTTKLTN